MIGAGRRLLVPLPFGGLARIRRVALNRWQRLQHRVCRHIHGHALTWVKNTTTTPPFTSLLLLSVSIPQSSQNDNTLTECPRCFVVIITNFQDLVFPLLLQNRFPLLLNHPNQVSVHQQINRLEHVLHVTQLLHFLQLQRLTKPL